MPSNTQTQKESKSQFITVGTTPLTSSDFHKILYEGQKVELDHTALKKVEESHAFLKTFSTDKLIYGINTGFGPMAQYHISDQDRIELQYNLIRSHCTGAGKRLGDIYVKSAMICRLTSLMQGYSGIHTEVVHLLRDLINHDIYPQIFEHGGVGASGDLVQLAHLSLNLIGEGEVTYKGELRPTAEVYKEVGLKPITVHMREGLGLINGTSVMTGIAMVNLLHAKQLLNWSLASSILIIEMVESYSDHFSKELNQVKPHLGQQTIAKAMNNVMSSSKLIRKREEHLFDGSYKKETVFQDKVQEYYSIRCVPQILGPVLDTIYTTENVLENEVNSVNDNPIIDKENNNVFHGGNFHGDYVALEMDKLKIAITKLTMLAERQLNFLMNDKLNGKLPPFVNLGKLGLNLGMQAAQFTATSTTAENQMLSNPMYIHSIPNNNDNQDIVSMGTNAAVITAKVVENAYQVLAIELLTAVQAIDVLKTEKKLSASSQQTYQQIRTLVPRFEDDTILYKKLAAIKQHTQTHNPQIL
ncbi:MAG TPA: aromatic amino acid ammonia-lyase [Bacteroidia bacterium]|jgi:histidine ammonia-lyase|nr:aromatic amino acid ammonia-lyase [Bacteroidia bacterium]